MRQPRDSGPSFEETYPHYPFAELVRLAIAAGRWIARSRQSRQLRAQRTLQASASRSRTKEAVSIPVDRILY